MNYSIILLFILLSPGVLLTIPNSAKGTVSLPAVFVHTIIFAIILSVFRIEEGFQLAIGASTPVWVSVSQCYTDIGKPLASDASVDSCGCPNLQTVESQKYSESTIPQACTTPYTRPLSNAQIAEITAAAAVPVAPGQKGSPPPPSTAETIDNRNTFANSCAEFVNPQNAFPSANVDTICSMCPQQNCPRQKSVCTVCPPQQQSKECTLQSAIQTSCTIM